MKSFGMKIILAFLLTAMLVWQAPPVRISALEKAKPSYSASATSETEGHGAENAADGNTETYWEADKNDVLPALVCDLGELRGVTGYKQIFLTSDVWSFAVYGAAGEGEWVTIADYKLGAPGKMFADSANGFYRFVKIEFYGSENASAFTSCEFTVDSAPLSQGTNIALGMKGYSGSWAAGFEHEKAFDGDTGSYYCANDGNFPQYCGVRWEYECSVKSVEVYLQDYGSYEFEVTAEGADGKTTLAERAARRGTYFCFETDGLYSSVEFKVYSGPGWANLTEMKVNGFKDLASPACGQAAEGKAEDGSLVYSFPYGAYVDSVQGEEVFVSDDGSAWTAANPASVGTVCKFLKMKKSDAAKLFGVPLVKDLAQGLKGAVSDYSNEGFNALKCTTNPEHEDGRNQFWCAETYDGAHWLQIDLGNVCRVEKVVQRFQDPGSYQFKIEASADGSEWTALYNGEGSYAQGQTFEAATGEEKMFRYVKLTVIDSGWANSNQFQIFGFGEAVPESWWLRESGVVRYYPKEQKVSIAEMTEKLEYYRANGFKVIEVHQPYEGVGDIWSGLGATDNYNADPVNGTLDDWNAFLDKAHSLGMYAFMFGNVGYARSTAEFFRKACLDYANHIKSEERDWFLFSENCPDPTKWFWSDTANAYYYGFWGENGQIPNYNFNGAAWQRESKKYVTYWADFGFDGVALDAPPAYYFGSENPSEVTYECITKPLNARNIMILPEGTGDSNYIYSYHYTAVQNYNMGGWGGGAWSLGIDAVTDCNASTVDDFIKSGRDNVVSLGGSAIAPLSFEQKYENVEDYKRKAEAALLTTSGHMAFLHSGTSAFVGQDIIEKDWSADLRDSVFELFTLQNSYAAFNAGGMRYRVPTNDDSVYYAYCKADRRGGTRAVVVFNYSASEKQIEVDLSGTGFGGAFVDMLTGKVVEGAGKGLKLTIPGGSYKILGQF